jgi:AcrR family transcriptional regulator
VTAATGRRERTKAANRAAILRAALEAFGELGYEGVAVRDIVRRTPLASGTFYNYFPDKDAVFAAVVADAARSARRRVQAARAEAGSYPELVERGFRAYFEWVVEDPVRFAFLRRNLARGRGEALPPGVSELARDLAVHDDVAAADLDYLAHAMVAVAVELGARMAERDPPDVDGATRFATGLFLTPSQLSPRR